jgi:hypothetical protein
LAAGTTLFANPSQAQSVEKSSEYYVAEVACIPEQHDVVPMGAVQGTQTPYTISVPVRENKWTGEDSARFQYLVRLRAKNQAGDEEQREFADLQSRRRNAIHTPTSAEIIAECQRRRMANEILAVLNRHVRFFNPEDQKRIRSISQAH